MAADIFEVVVLHGAHHNRRLAELARSIEPVVCACADEFVQEAQIASRKGERKGENVTAQRGHEVAEAMSRIALGQP